MANLQTESSCAGGIGVNTSAVYTMIRLPQGTFGSVGFRGIGSLFYDTGTKTIIVKNEGFGFGDYYEVSMVEFTKI